MNKPMNSVHVGLVGLGLMGRGIGLSLLRAGHPLHILPHKRRETAEELIAAGAQEAATPAELGRRSDVVVSCLPSGEAVEHVLLGPSGIARSDLAARPRSESLLVIECSTLTPEMGLALESAVSEAGLAFVDAPLTRGPREAVEGKLNAFVGGEPHAVERATPVLRAFCERVFSFGTAGSGYAAKLVNNFLAFSALVSVAEAIATADSAGLDQATLMEAISVSGGQSRVLDGLAPVIAGSGSSRSIVTLATANKDVAYYLDLARSLGTDGPVAHGVVERLSTAIDAGLGDRLTPDYLGFIRDRKASRS